MFVCRALPIALVLSLSAACGGEAKKADPAPAQEAAEPAEDPAIAKRRNDRLAKEKAEKDAEAARVAAIDALAVLPAKLPKDLGKACEAVADAQLKFFERMYDGAKFEKIKAAQGTQRPSTISGCTGVGSLEAAACQVAAFDAATDPTLGSSVSDIMRVCNEKFAKPQG